MLHNVTIINFPVNIKTKKIFKYMYRNLIMSFDFHVASQNLQNVNLYPVSVQTPKNVQNAGLFDVNNIQEQPKIDSFVKTNFQGAQQTNQNQNFESIYQSAYNAQKINDVISPQIQAICDKNSINSKVTAEQVINIGQDHIKKTYEYAMMIGNRMNLSPNEKEDLKTASILHDIGKAYIPSEILHKPDRLTPEERNVINSHAELGGELARQLGANENVVDIIKKHHTDNSGNKLCDILQVADRYSALTQRRSYKNPFSPSLTFKILDKEVEEGKLNKEALDALKQAINAQNNMFNSYYRI